jgi:hypothetical protein
MRVGCAGVGRPGAGSPPGDGSPTRAFWGRGSPSLRGASGSVARLRLRGAPRRAPLRRARARAALGGHGADVGGGWGVGCGTSRDLAQRPPHLLKSGQSVNTQCGAFVPVHSGQPPENSPPSYWPRQFARGRTRIVPDVRKSRRYSASGWSMPGPCRYDTRPCSRLVPYCAFRSPSPAALSSTSTCAPSQIVRSIVAPHRVSQNGVCSVCVTIRRPSPSYTYSSRRSSYPAGSIVAGSHRRP